MKFAKITATLFGVAYAGMPGGMSATTTTSGGHSAKKVVETVHCGQYPKFVPNYKNEWKHLQYNSYSTLPNIDPHGAVSQDFSSTAYIPADKYVNGKWCVNLDIKLSLKF